jgi:O-antigen/teichoic acid export membrane protein
MDPTSYGIVMFAMGFVALFTFISNMGLGSAHIKRVHENNDTNICNGTFISLKLLGTVAFIILTIGSLFIWKYVLQRGFETPTHETAIYLMIGYYVLTTIGANFTIILKAQREIACSQSALITATLTRTIAIIYVAIMNYGPVALALTYIIGEIGFIAVSIILFKKRKHHIAKPTKPYIKDYLTFAWPLAIVPVAALLLKNTDKVFIQLFYSAADVGYYAAGYRITTFLIMLISSIGMLFFPTFSKLYAENKKEQVYRTARTAERYISMLIFPAVFGLALLAEPTAHIFLNQWNDTIPILQTLPFYALFLALTQPYDSQFAAMNKPKVARNRVLLMAGSNIILNLILIPKDIQALGFNGMGLGATGAVIATIIAYAIGFAYTRIKIYKLTGQIGYPRIAIHFICAALMSGIVLNITYYIPIERWYHLVFVGLMGAGTYFLLLYLFKEFTKKDWDFFIETLNIKKMAKYIKDELTGR